MLKEYNTFISELGHDLCKAERHLRTYTPNNAEQEYKHNNYNTLLEIVNYSKRTNNLIDIFNYLSECYLNSLNNKSIGICETYHNTLERLIYTDKVKRYLYDKDTYLLEGTYGKTLRKLNFYYPY